jgi:hypothetical protein
METAKVGSIVESIKLMPTILFYLQKCPSYIDSDSDSDIGVAVKPNPTLLGGGDCQVSHRRLQIYRAVHYGQGWTATSLDGL